MTPTRRRLGAALRRLRVLRYPSQEALGERLGWTQTRVSKLERGAQLPSAADLAVWVAATGAAPEQVEELERLLADARLGYRAWADTWASGRAAELQDEIADRDADAALVQEYQPSLVPGLLQTPGYTRAALASTALAADQVAEVAAARARRQQRTLYGGATRFQFVVGQAALLLRFGSVAAHRAQLDRLLTVPELDGVEFGVLPLSRRSPVLPLSGFVIVDGESVEVETLAGEQRLTLPEDVAVYQAAFDAAYQAAVFGDLVADLLST